MSDTSITARKTLQDESLANAHRAGRVGSPRVFSIAHYTRPQAVIARVVTEDFAAIAAAGDQFLRYGYAMAGRQWTIGTLTQMSHFTYWRGRLHIGETNMNAGSRDVIQSIFDRGTTVWQNPSEIGSVSIYDNGI